MSDNPQQAAPQGEQGSGIVSFEQRLSEMQAEIRQEAMSPQPAADPAGASSPAPLGDAPSGSAADSGDEDARAQDRRARLARLQEQERARVDARRRSSDAERLSAELAATKRRAQELEESVAKRIERAALKDPMVALRMLEEEGVPADKLAEAIRSRLTDPEAAAAHAAVRAVDPKLAALEKQNAEMAAQLQAFMEAQEQRERAAQEQRETGQFLNHVARSGGLSARFLEAEGPEPFLKLAHKAAAMLPDGAGPAALHDQIEELLATNGRQIAQKLASIYGLVSEATPSNGQTPPKPAAAKANNTVSNTIAQERASVVTEDELWRLPFEERLARLKKAM